MKFSVFMSMRFHGEKYLEKNKQPVNKKTGTKRTLCQLLWLISQIVFVLLSPLENDDNDVSCW